MTILQQAITIVLCAFGTLLTRFLPFLVFSPKKPTPKYIQYLGFVETMFQLSFQCLLAFIIPVPVKNYNCSGQKGQNFIL